MTDTQRYDEALDVVDVMRPLHRALDKLKHAGRLHGMAGGYRWTDDQVARVGDTLERLGEVLEHLKSQQSKAVEISIAPPIPGNTRPNGS